jgi:hypothetical protein
MRLTLGAHDVTLGDEEGRIECRAAQMKQHPDFDGAYNDIMMIRIKCLKPVRILEQKSLKNF